MLYIYLASTIVPSWFHPRHNPSFFCTEYNNYVFWKYDCSFIQKKMHLKTIQFKYKKRQFYNHSRNSFKDYWKTCVIIISNNCITISVKILKKQSFWWLWNCISVQFPNILDMLLKEMCAPMRTMTFISRTRTK